MAQEEHSTVAVVAAPAIVREGLAALIASFGGYTVPIRAAHGEDYLAQSRTRPVQLAVVALALPVMDGFATLAWMRQHQPTTRALAIDGEMGPEAVHRAARAGARALLRLDLSPAELALALGDVRTAGLHLNALMRARIERGPLAPQAEVVEAERWATLSPRENEAVRWLLHSPVLPVGRIALRMKVGEATVSSFIKRSYRKLGVHSREELIFLAARHGRL